MLMANGLDFFSFFFSFFESVMIGFTNDTFSEFISKIMEER